MSIIKNKWAILFATILGTMWISASAAAQPPRANRGRGGRAPRVIQLEEFVIQGRVQKPNAFYILNRSNLGYEVMELRTSFVREIIDSVRREPF